MATEHPVDARREPLLLEANELPPKLHELIGTVTDKWYRVSLTAGPNRVLALVPGYEDSLWMRISLDGSWEIWKVRLPYRDAPI